MEALSAGSDSEVPARSQALSPQRLQRRRDRAAHGHVNTVQSNVLDAGVGFGAMAATAAEDAQTAPIAVFIQASKPTSVPAVRQGHSGAAQRVAETTPLALSQAF